MTHNRILEGVRECLTKYSTRHAICGPQKAVDLRFYDRLRSNAVDRRDRLCETEIMLAPVSAATAVSINETERADEKSPVVWKEQ
jgi:hypothetical protein